MTRDQARIGARVAFDSENGEMLGTITDLDDPLRPPGWIGVLRDGAKTKKTPLPWWFDPDDLRLLPDGDQP